MSCPAIRVLGMDEFYADRLQSRIHDQRVPATVSMDATDRCNLRCAHCWISGPGCKPDPAPEMTTAEFLEVFDQLRDIGCLWLLMTGGEPLLRSDFPELYTAAKQRGMLVTVFTNGTLVTETLADLFRDMPPSSMEVTLYGATEETYTRVTGVAGALARCRRGIELLLDRGVDLSLKSVVHRLNVSELDTMRAMAEAYGVKFRHDAALNRGVQRERHPLDYRLSPRETLRLNMATEDWPRQMQEYIDRARTFEIVRDRLFSCGAGVDTLHIDCHGRLSPCMMLRDRPIDIRGGRLARVWETDVQERLQRPWSDESRCKTCDLLGICEECPAYAWLETGDLETPVDFLCELTHLIAKEFGVTKDGEDEDDEQQEPQR